MLASPRSQDHGSLAVTHPAWEDPPFRHVVGSRRWLSRPMWSPPAKVPRLNSTSRWASFRPSSKVYQCDAVLWSLSRWLAGYVSAFTVSVIINNASLLQTIIIIYHPFIKHKLNQKPFVKHYSLFSLINYYTKTFAKHQQTFRYPFDVHLISILSHTIPCTIQPTSASWPATPSLLGNSATMPHWHHCDGFILASPCHCPWDLWWHESWWADPIIIRILMIIFRGCFKDVLRMFWECLRTSFRQPKIISWGMPSF